MWYPIGHMYQNTTGQVLGASVAIAAGVAVLPNTGDNKLLLILPILSVVVGAAYLVSLLATRFLKKVH